MSGYSSELIATGHKIGRCVFALFSGAWMISNILNISKKGLSELGESDIMIAGSPDRRIAGSPDRRIAGSGFLRLVGGTA